MDKCVLRAMFVISSWILGILGQFHFDRFFLRIRGFGCGRFFDVTIFFAKSMFWVWSSRVCLSTCLVFDR